MRIVNTCHYADLPREHPAFQRVLAKAEFVTCEKKQLTSEELLEFVQGGRRAHQRHGFHPRGPDRALPQVAESHLPPGGGL